MKEERRILGMLCLLYANALILALPSKGPTSKTRVQKPLDLIGPSLVASGKKKSSSTINRRLQNILHH